MRKAHSRSWQCSYYLDGFVRSVIRCKTHEAWVFYCHILVLTIVDLPAPSLWTSCLGLTWNQGTRSEAQACPLWWCVHPLGAGLPQTSCWIWACREWPRPWPHLGLCLRPFQSILLQGRQWTHSFCLLHTWSGRFTRGKSGKQIQGLQGRRQKELYLHR